MGYATLDYLGAHAVCEQQHARHYIGAAENRTGTDTKLVHTTNLPCPRRQHWGTGESCI